MVRDCFQIATLSWNVPYDSFWRMSLQEWYWIYDVRRSDAQKASILTDRELWASIGEEAPF